MNDIRYVSKVNSDKASILEKNFLNTFSQITNNKSLLIHSSFSNPGKQILHLIPNQEIRFRSRPILLSLWVHSQSYKHALRILIQNISGKIIKIEMGNLNWMGWRRVETVLPYKEFAIDRMTSNQKYFLLKGIQIVSHPHEKHNDFALMLDNIVLLSDTSGSQYPGAEFSDSW